MPPMQKKKITSVFNVFDKPEELPESTQELFKAAEKARDTAYAPYSRFLVGAAIRLKSGKIITGSNQENAAYPSGLCAERVAIFYAGANHPDEIIEELAVTVKSTEKVVDNPAPPCGSCRQAIAEYEFKQNQHIRIYFRGETGQIIQSESLIDLLPLAFDSTFM